MRVVELQGQHPGALKRQIILTPDLSNGLQAPVKQGKSDIYTVSVIFDTLKHPDTDFGINNHICFNGN